MTCCPTLPGDAPVASCIDFPAAAVVGEAAAAAAPVEETDELDLRNDRVRLTLALADVVEATAERATA